MTVAIAALIAVMAPTEAAGAPLDGEARAMLDPRRLELFDLPRLFSRLALPDSAAIADVGAGPGLLTLELARLVPRGRVLATDIRGDVLDLLARRATAAGIANIRTRVVNPDAPGLAARSFDLVVLCQVDHYLRDRQRYLSALRGTLRKGGRLVLINYNQYREPALAAARSSLFRLVDQWNPSRPFYVAVLEKDGRQ